MLTLIVFTLKPKWTRTMVVLLTAKVGKSGRLSGGSMSTQLVFQQ